MSRKRKRQCSCNPLWECTLLHFTTSGGCYCLHRSITGFGSRDKSRDGALGRWAGRDIQPALAPIRIAGDPHATRDSPDPLRTHQQPDNLGLAGTAYDRHAFTAQPVCRDHSDARIRYGRRTIREQNCFIEFLFDLARISVGCCKKDTDNVGGCVNGGDTLRAHHHCFATSKRILAWLNSAPDTALQ